MGFWRVDETAFDLFSRLARPPLCLTEPAGSTPLVTQLHVGEALEVFGEPGSGKTATLFEMLMRCILPAGYGGLGAAAILIDTDGLDLTRLAIDLQRHYRSTHGFASHEGVEPFGRGRRCIAKPSGCGSDLPPVTSMCEGEDEGEVSFAHQCLSRLYVLRAGDRHEFGLALHAVLGYISQPAGDSAVRSRIAVSPVRCTDSSSCGCRDTADSAENRQFMGLLPQGSNSGLLYPDRVQLVAIDSISRFQWYSRAQRRIPSLSDPDAMISALLARIMRRRTVAVIWTRSPLSKPEDDMFPVPNSTDPLTSLCAFTLCLRRLCPARLDGSPLFEGPAEGLLTIPGGATRRCIGGSIPPVSYTHLTLPPKRIV